MPVTFDHNDQIILVSIYTYLEYKVYLLWNPDEIEEAVQGIFWTWIVFRKPICLITVFVSMHFTQYVFGRLIGFVIVYLLNCTKPFPAPTPIR